MWSSLPRRAAPAALIAIATLASGLAFVTSACSGSSANSHPNACVACGAGSCATQASACQSTLGCNSGLSCLLQCASGDAACQNKCVAAAGSNNAAYLAGADYYQCLTTACPDACGPQASGTGTGGVSEGTGGISGSSSGGAVGTGGRSGSSSGGAVGTGGRSASGGSSGTGGVSGPQGVCQDLLGWAVGCVVDNEPMFRSCDAKVPLDVCEANCYVRATCANYADMKAGKVNTLSTCVNACIINYSTNPPPLAATCVNAQTKLVACDTPAPDPLCSDTDPVDMCSNTCIVNADCRLVYDSLFNNVENAFSNCLNGCYGGTPTPGFTVGAGGYVTAGPWMGYAFTGTDGKSSSTILPKDFSAVLMDGELCVNGTVVATADYSAVAFLGLNLNQPLGGGTGTELTWTPTGSGIAYDTSQHELFANLRVQIQAAGGDTNANLRWCAQTTGNSGMIPWTSFNTKCWDGTGTPYNGTTPLQSAMILIPGDIFDLPFQVCVKKLAPY